MAAGSHIIYLRPPYMVTDTKNIEELPPDHSFCTPIPPDYGTGHIENPDRHPPSTRNIPYRTQVCVKGRPETKQKRENKKEKTKMADFTTSTTTKSAIRSLAEPLADVTALDNLVQGVTSASGSARLRTALLVVVLVVKSAIFVFSFLFSLFSFVSGRPLTYTCVRYGILRVLGGAVRGSRCARFRNPGVLACKKSDLEVILRYFWCEYHVRGPQVYDSGTTSSHRASPFHSMYSFLGSVM